MCRSSNDRPSRNTVRCQSTHNLFKNVFLSFFRQFGEHASEESARKRPFTPLPTPPCSARSINPPRFYFHKRARLSLKRKQRVCEKTSQTKVNRLSYTIRDISGLICFLFLERRSLLLNSKLSTVKQTIYGRRAGTLVDIWVSAQCCESR